MGNILVNRVEHGEVSKAYPLGHASNWADRTLREAHEANPKRLVPYSRKNAAYGHRKQMPKVIAPKQGGVSKGVLGVAGVAQSAGAAVPPGVKSKMLVPVTPPPPPGAPSVVKKPPMPSG